MHRLIEFIDNELMELEEEIKSGHKLSGSELEYGDKLAHFKKSLLTNEAMEESGYSRRYMPIYRYDGSYARGRGRGAKRDSMGRYSRGDGYSYADGMDDIISDIRSMMHDLPEEKRHKVERLVNELES